MVLGTGLVVERRLGVPGRGYTVYDHDYNHKVLNPGPNGKDYVGEDPLQDTTPYVGLVSARDETFNQIFNPNVGLQYLANYFPNNFLRPNPMKGQAQSPATTIPGKNAATQTQVAVSGDPDNAVKQELANEFKEGREAFSTNTAATGSVPIQGSTSSGLIADPKNAALVKSFNYNVEQAEAVIENSNNERRGSISKLLGEAGKTLAVKAYEGARSYAGNLIQEKFGNVSPYVGEKLKDVVNSVSAETAGSALKSAGSAVSAAKDYVLGRKGSDKSSPTKSPTGNEKPNTGPETPRAGPSNDTFYTPKSQSSGIVTGSVESVSLEQRLDSAKRPPRTTTAPRIIVGENVIRSPGLEPFFGVSSTQVADKKLSQDLDSKVKTLQTFLTNTEYDRKLENIIEKYTARDSVVPTSVLNQLAQNAILQLVNTDTSEELVLDTLDTELKQAQAIIPMVANLQSIADGLEPGEKSPTKRKAPSLNVVESNKRPSVDYTATSTQLWSEQNEIDARARSNSIKGGGLNIKMEGYPDPGTPSPAESSKPKYSPSKGPIYTGSAFPVSLVNEILGTNYKRRPPGWQQQVRNTDKARADAIQIAYDETLKQKQTTPQSTKSKKNTKETPPNKRRWK